MPIGQAGSITTNSPTENAPITITFDQPLENPVIALTATNNGGNQFTLRVTEVTDNSFTFIIEEWEYHDGAHPAIETINWLAIEEGVHTLPDGRVIEAGTSQVSDSSGNATLSGGFTDPPVVLTSVMSENETTTVDSDPQNITSTGFDLRLQEEEAQDGTHVAETVGWIAIQAGGDTTSGTAQTFGGVDENTDTLGLGGTFTDAVVLGETQTINGGDTATVVIDGQTNSTVGLFIEEEQSNDNETNHINEVVGVVAFEDGLIPCYTPGTLIMTRRGEVEVTRLRPGDEILTRDAGFQPLRWLSQTRVTGERLKRQPNLQPILIRKNAFGPGLPAADMRVSPQHRMLLSGWKVQLYTAEDEILAPAKGLINDKTVVQQAAPEGVSFIHLLFDAHHVIYANGVPSESLHAGQISKYQITPEARHELLELLPDLRCFENAYGDTARRVLKVEETRAFGSIAQAGLVSEPPRFMC